jgi:UDP-hydrolysing UDP-N-acetyl-D-glucosamine 2-epimerase
MPSKGIPDPRRIAVVTVGRSDYSAYVPVLDALDREPTIEVSLIVAGAHLSSKGGHSVRDIVASGRSIAGRVPMLLSGDGPEDAAIAMGLGTIGFAHSFARDRPDLLLVLGDRFEMHAAVVASVPFNIPVAHLHGGELSFGAIDDAFRHSITKMSHLHFAATDVFAKRLMAMGEEPWRITVTGAPALDAIRTMPLPSRADVAERFFLRLDVPPLLVTHHPTTRDLEAGKSELRELLAALQQSGRPIVFTAPNADPGGGLARTMISEFVEGYTWAVLIENFGPGFYFAMLREAAAMIGNSSSGIIEAGSFELPVVNIGSRQEGRPRGPNVIDATPDCQAIACAIKRATSASFRRTLVGMTNLYGDGMAAGRVVSVLKQTPVDARLVTKRFYEAGRFH